MEVIAKILVGVVAFEHLFIMYMEMFAWETLGKKTFKGAMPDELFSQTLSMAANQGLYNGFLAAGLIWSFFIKDAAWQTNIVYFFLGCVIVAGTYGAASVSSKIFVTQAVPAILALVIWMVAH